MRRERSSILPWQKDLLDNYEKFLVKEDDPIYEYDCVKCGGRCCTNTNVLISPYDIWRIMHDYDVCSSLGVQSTHDLFAPFGVRRPSRRFDYATETPDSAEGPRSSSDSIEPRPAHTADESGRPLLKYYLGPDSRVPLACINMVPLSKDFRICPFNAPVVLLRDKADVENLKGGRLDGLDFAKSSDGGAVRLCALEQAKPTICRAYPLGRACKYGPDGKNRGQKMDYVKMDTAWCDRFKTSASPLTVKEYVQKWDLDTAYRMSDLVSAWHNELRSKVKNETDRYLRGLFVYDFDLPALELSHAMRLNGDKTRRTLEKFRPKKFEELLERSLKLAEDACKGELSVPK